MSSSPLRTETEWRWQLKPLMVAMLVLLTLFFFGSTLYQLMALNAHIEQGPQLDGATLISQTVCPPALSHSDCVALKRMNISAALEANVVARRYHQANVVLMSSIWSRYLGFVTGMILALVGATFILGRLRDHGTQLEGSTPSGRAVLTSASPGIVLAVLGVALMITTITTLHQLNTRDVALYFPGDALGFLPPPEIGAPADIVNGDTKSSAPLTRKAGN